MPGEDRPRVFILYSPADDAGRVLRRRLADSFELFSPEMLTGSTDRRTALLRSLLNIDVAVVLFPPVSDPSWRNVLFEAGMAAGTGIPLVLVGQAASVPAGLADSLIFEPDQTDEIISMVRDYSESEQVIRRRSPLIVIQRRDEVHGIDDEYISASDERSAVSFEYAANWIKRLIAAKDGLSAIRLVSELFRDAGARVRTEPYVSSAGDVTKPDLVLWHDDLLAAFGLPLPVEVLLQAKSWPAIRPRLERTLVAVGGRTLMAITVHGEHDAEVWTDGRRTILFAPAARLARSLAEMPLAEALSTMLTSAAA